MTKKQPPYRRHIDEDGNETEPWSHRPVTDDHTRLTNGAPIRRDLYDLVMKGVREAVRTFPRNLPLEAKWFVGVPEWLLLSRADRIRAGHCLADIARREGSPIQVIRRPGQSHCYFVRPALSSGPSINPKA